MSQLTPKLKTKAQKMKKLIKSKPLKHSVKMPDGAVHSFSNFKDKMHFLKKNAAVKNVMKPPTPPAYSAGKVK